MGGWHLRTSDAVEPARVLEARIATSGASVMLVVMVRGGMVGNEAVRLMRLLVMVSLILLVKMRLTVLLVTLMLMLMLMLCLRV